MNPEKHKEKSQHKKNSPHTVSTNELEEMEFKYKRALADYQNLVKQTQKERSEYIIFSNESLIVQLLPLLDNLELALNHLKDPGIEMIVKQFHQVLSDVGTKLIEPQVGETFDPHFHECVDTITESDSLEDTIAKIKQFGYKWEGGRVIRHAKVIVYKHPETSNQEEAQKPY